MTTNTRPPYHWGVIAPARGEEAGETNSRTESLLPPEVITLSNALGIRDYTSEGVEEAMARYPDCVRDLVSRGAQRVCLNGIPISVQLGRPRVLELIENSPKHFGVSGDTAGEAAVAGMKHLGVSKIAVGSRWADEVNNALIRYLADAGIEVLTMTSRRQWAQQAFSMSFEMGVRLAFELGREAMRQAPQAEALFLPGGAWRPLAAIPILEEDYGKPVFTNENTRVWRLIHDGIAPPVEGWGRLLATP
jgi:maleate cis-trans isomerase